MPSRGSPDSRESGGGRVGTWQGGGRRQFELHDIGENPHQFKPSDKGVSLFGDAYFAAGGIGGLEPKCNFHAPHRPPEPSAGHP